MKGSFHSSHQHATDWLQKRAIELHDFRKKSNNLIAATSLAGTMMMGQPVDAQVQAQLQNIKSGDLDKFISTVSAEERTAILEKLQSIVQQPAGHLPQDQELYLEQQLSDMLGFEVTAELEGHRLNHSIGIMGGEQHLRRFPTDTLDQHDAYLEAGIAPNRGAFGWFTEHGELTDQAIQREKYYFAVQTLYLPDWNSNYAQLKPWYHFRKMIVINPAEEVAVVGVVGDAGPAQWVKKQYGGSPEIIREGKIWSPKSRGRVMLLFIDDPMDQVPLGPISLSQPLTTGAAVQHQSFATPSAGNSAETETSVSNSSASTASGTPSEVNTEAGKDPDAS